MRKRKKINKEYNTQEGKQNLCFIKRRCIQYVEKEIKNCKIVDENSA
jgi:hypothetical protein